MKLAVIGSGYVALVTAACFAGLGHSVLYASQSSEESARIVNGELTYFEEGLESLLTTELETGNLTICPSIAEAVAASQVVFLSEGAPPLPDGRPDMKPILLILEEILEGMQDDTTDTPKLIVERSTLPIKTAEWLLEQFKERLPAGTQVDVAAVPQFLREGHAIKDFYQPDRIVIGAETQRAVDLLVSLFSPLRAPMLITDINSAEMIKHATNAFLAMKISFINSMAQLCERVGADVTQVSKGLGMDSRISPEFLNAGLGYGGIFLPRDVQSLIGVAQEHSLNLDLLKATDVINRYQRISFIERIERAVGGNLSGKTVAVWGLAYRPNTDDMRDTPSSQIIFGLQNRGATIRAYDPIAMPAAAKRIRRVKFCESAYEAAQGADVIAVLTEWDEFVGINFKQLKDSTSCRLMVDGRNLYSPKRMRELGFAYHSIGRPAVEPATAPKWPETV
jgi:UDPglucose 6-dehydrogenase